MKLSLTFIVLMVFFALMLGISMVSGCAKKDAAQSSPVPNTINTTHSQRPYEQNFKDIVLAQCVTAAYKNEKSVAGDVGGSVSALIEVTYYNLEEATDLIPPLIDRYLARDYSSPIVEVKGLRFDFLKCLDLYHSKDLEDMARRLVSNPNRTFQQDYPQEKPDTKAQ